MSLLSETTHASTEKQMDVRTSNIQAAKGLLDLIRTSLGPRGLDKMVKTASGDVLITNDGATIMKQIEARHPAAKMLVELSQSQDIEAGDGTTSVVVLAASMLSSCLKLFKLGIHPTTISEAFQLATKEAERIVMDISQDVDLEDREALAQIATTTLSSKVISSHSEKLAPIVVRAALKIRTPAFPDNIDLRRVRIAKKVGGTLDMCRIVEGLVFPKRPIAGPTFVKGAKIGLARFHLSPPKTDMDSSVIVSDDAAITRLLQQERKLTLRMCKKVAKSGCNVLLLQKSILRESVSDMALHYLKKLKITVISDVEREDMEFISQTIGAEPISTLEEFKPSTLGHADQLKEEGGITYITGCHPADDALPTCSILVRGANKLIVDEADRSLHDALCAIRCLVKIPKMLPGGGAVETEVARRLYEFSHRQLGMSQYCIREYANAFEVIPITLAENAGLNPIDTVTELRKAHADGKVQHGINLKKNGKIMDMVREDIKQPALVSISAISLATETVRMILKIDDLVVSR